MLYMYLSFFSFKALLNVNVSWYTNLLLKAKNNLTITYKKPKCSLLDKMYVFMLCLIWRYWFTKCILFMILFIFCVPNPFCFYKYLRTDFSIGRRKRKMWQTLSVSDMRDSANKVIKTAFVLHCSVEISV